MQSNLWLLAGKQFLNLRWGEGFCTTRTETKDQACASADKLAYLQGQKGGGGSGCSVGERSKTRVAETERIQEG